MHTSPARLLLSWILPGQSNAGSGRALSRPGCPASSAGKVCPLIPCPVLMVHPRGPGAAVWDGGWVSSELQRRDWCKCEEIGCMDERTKSQRTAYIKKKRKKSRGGREWSAGQALSPTSWECSNSTLVSKLEGCSEMSKQDHKTYLIMGKMKTWCPTWSECDVLSRAFIFNRKMYCCLSRLLCVAACSARCRFELRVTLDVRIAEVSPWKGLKRL